VEKSGAFTFSSKRKENFAKLLRTPGGGGKGQAGGEYLCVVESSRQKANTSARKNGKKKATARKGWRKGVRGTFERGTRGLGSGTTSEQRRTQAGLDLEVREKPWKGHTPTGHSGRGK